MRVRYLVALLAALFIVGANPVSAHALTADQQALKDLYAQNGIVITDAQAADPNYWTLAFTVTSFTNGNDTVLTTESTASYCGPANDCLGPPVPRTHVWYDGTATTTFKGKGIFGTLFRLTIKKHFKFNGLRVDSHWFEVLPDITNYGTLGGWKYRGQTPGTSDHSQYNTGFGYYHFSHSSWKYRWFERCQGGVDFGCVTPTYLTSYLKDDGRGYWSTSTTKA